MDLKCTHGSSRFGRRRRSSRRKPVFQPSGISTTQWTDGEETNPFPTKCIHKSKARSAYTDERAMGRLLGASYHSEREDQQFFSLKQLAVRDAMNPPFASMSTSRSALLKFHECHRGKNCDSRSIDGRMCGATTTASIASGLDKTATSPRIANHHSLLYTSLEIGQSTCLPNEKEEEEEEEGTQ